MGAIDLIRPLFLSVFSDYRYVSQLLHSIQHNHRFHWRIIRYTQQFLLSQTPKLDRKMLVFFYETYWSLRDILVRNKKKRMEKPFSELQSGFLFSLYLALADGVTLTRNVRLCWNANHLHISQRQTGYFLQEIAFWMFSIVKEFTQKSPYSSCFCDL